MDLFNDKVMRPPSPAGSAPTKDAVQFADLASAGRKLAAALLQFLRELVGYGLAMDERLTQADFTKQLNMVFLVKVGAPRPVELNLVEVKGYANGANEESRMERFSLYFILSYVRNTYRIWPSVTLRDPRLFSWRLFYSNQLYDKD